MIAIPTTAAAPARRPMAHADPGALPTQAQVDGLLADCIGELWSLLERGRAEADARLVRTGCPGRIATRVAGIERRYALGGRRDERFISVFLSIPAHDGHIFGGAFVTSSATRASLYLRPSIADGVACWTLPLSGTAFTAATVRDLFLSAFEGDVAATGRIAPLVGCDPFLTPWS